MSITVQSATTLTFAGSDPASQNLTIPASNKATVVAITAYAGAGLAVSSLTLGGNAPDNFFLYTGDALENGAYIAVWFNLSAGTLALDPAFNATPTEGPLCQICYITADGSLSHIDSDAIAETDADTASITLTSNTGDFVLGHAQRFGDVPTHNGTDVSGGAQENVNEFGQLFTLTAGASTTTAESSDANYSSVSGIVLRESGGAAPAPTPQSGLAFTLGMGGGFRKPRRDDGKWTRGRGERIWRRAA